MPGSTTADGKPALITDYFTFINTQKSYKPKTTHRIISTLLRSYRFLLAGGDCGKT